MPMRLTSAGASSRFLANLEALDILPYYRIGEPKWRLLGRSYKLHGVVPHARDRVFELVDIAREYRI